MSDIDTVVVDSLKALDPEWPIREVVMSGGMWGLYEAVNSAVPRRELGSKVGILARGRTYNLHKLPEM